MESPHPGGGNTLRRNMVEAGGYWDGFVNGDDSFHKVINMLDFPLESLEADNGVDLEDWEAQFQRLGPIPLEILQGLAPGSQSNTGNGASGATSELKQLPDVIDSSHAKRSRLFQTLSPISVLENSSSCSAKKSIFNNPKLVIPVRTRTKIRRSLTSTKWHLISPITPENDLNREGKEQEKKLSQLSNDSEMEENQHMPSKRCPHCHSKTPQWRGGPMGPKTCCNACGVRYRSGRLFPEYRPAASPTFVPSLISAITPAKNDLNGEGEEEEKELSQNGEGKEEKKKLSQNGEAKEEEKELSQLSNDSEIKENSFRRHLPIKRCTHCLATKTPQWRTGPMGTKTLCNACGVRYRSGRLFPEYRPAASPTFVPSLHSNSHKEVIQMRNKSTRKSFTSDMDAAPSPPPEFVPMSSYLFDRV